MPESSVHTALSYILDLIIIAFRDLANDQITVL